jgi:dihydroorotase
MVDLIVKSPRIVILEAIINGSVAINAGKVVALLNNAIFPEAKRVIDAEEKYLLPELIDAHVHFRDPGLLHYGDFKPGSTAAAFGGVTTVLDMPSTQPLVSTPEILKEKKTS